MRIGIIGGGASGMILAAKLRNKDVTILERNSKLGKKLLLTGNGKCNFTNLDFKNLSDIYNNDFASDIYRRYDNVSFIDFFKSIGIIPKIEKHKNISYIYPNTNKATSVYYCLYDKIIDNNINIIYNTYVIDIKHSDNSYKVICDDGKTYEFDKVVLSTGGNSYKNTGSDGTGYEIAKKLGHSINKIAPGLTALNYALTDKNIIIDGKCRVNASVKYQDNDKVIFYESGEIQITSDTISGIPVINFSSKIGRDLANKNDLILNIDFSDALINDSSLIDKQSDQSSKDNYELVLSKLIKRRDNTKYRKTHDFLCGYLPDEINESILKLSGVYNKKLSELNNIDFENIAKNIISFKVRIVSKPNFDFAQITLGGVNVDEIDINTLESKLVKGLYFTGELLDIDGKCGGYNLQLSYSSASIVADSLKGD